MDGFTLIIFGVSVYTFKDLSCFQCASWAEYATFPFRLRETPFHVNCTCDSMCDAKIQDLFILYPLYVSFGVQVQG